jgi:protein involved in polysaccharide export with SLBB domain
MQGEVGKSGEIELKGDTTLEEALLFAGIPKEALYGTVRVKRKQKGGLGYEEIVVADLKNGVVEDPQIGTMLLQPEDIVIVERNKTYLIYGEVNVPGEYVIDEANITVFKAILRAGGFTKWGSPKRISVLRQGKDKAGYETIKIDISSLVKGSAADSNPDLKLEPGDIIVVRAGIF